jgi:hypothetical protein
MHFPFGLTQQQQHTHITIFTVIEIPNNESEQLNNPSRDSHLSAHQKTRTGRSLLRPRYEKRASLPYHTTPNAVIFPTQTNSHVVTSLNLTTTTSIVSVSQTAIYPSVGPYASP